MLAFINLPSPCVLLSLQDEEHGNVHTIKITLSNASREDNNFQLSCIANNIVGFAKASVHLIVHCKL